MPKQIEQPIETEKSQKQQQLPPPVRLLQPPLQTMVHPPNFQLHFNPPVKQNASQQTKPANPAGKKRRRRKSRRQRKTQDRLPLQQILEWADRIPANHRSSREGNELLENANNIAFAISLRKSARVFNSSAHSNAFPNSRKETKTNASELKASATKLVPAILSNITLSNTPSKEDVRVNHRKQNLEHRNEVRWNDSVTYSVTSSITNKYNIDYDNRLEDDFEIIEKDE